MDNRIYTFKIIKVGKYKTFAFFSSLMNITTNNLTLVCDLCKDLRFLHIKYFIKGIHPTNKNISLNCHKCNHFLSRINVTY